MGSMARRHPNPGQQSSAEGEGGTEEELARLTGRENEEHKGANESNDKPGSDEPVSDMTGEYGNVGLLLLLYTLQGIPMGLSSTMPMLLKEKNASYEDLSMFTLVSYPFSMKLLWAPIVDSVYVQRIGRRKTWMVPAQIVIGLVMLAMSTMIDSLLEGEKPDVTTLTVLFFLLYFLCATQDIAVDGWALTMLRKENVGYAATCNTIGQNIGYALGFTGFMALHQFELVTLSGFVAFWGVVFIVVTAAVAVLKTESPLSKEDEPEDIWATYLQMFSMVKLKGIRKLALVLLTWKVGFAIADNVAPIKFQENGVKKEHMAYMVSALMPILVLLPVVVSKWTSSGCPLDLALRAYPARVALIPAVVTLSYFTPAPSDSIPWFFYSLVMLVTIAGAVTSQCMFVSQMAFFARISDPAIGGTYMTVLNTISNLGGMWPPTVTMALVGWTTCKEETCPVKRDGYYVMAVFCFVAGVIWFFVGTGTARRLQYLKDSEWKVR